MDQQWFPRRAAVRMARYARATLLGSLIGEALTKQLLHVAQTGADGQKHGQEQK